MSRKSRGTLFLPKLGAGAHTRGWISDAPATCRRSVLMRRSMQHAHVERPPKHAPTPDQDADGALDSNPMKGENRGCRGGYHA